MSSILQETLLNAHGIQVQVSSPRASQLIFTGTMEVRATVWCTASVIGVGVTQRNRVEVRIGKIAVIEIITTMIDSCTRSSITSY